MKKKQLLAFIGVMVCFAGCGRESTLQATQSTVEIQDSKESEDLKETTHAVKQEIVALETNAVIEDVVNEVNPNESSYMDELVAGSILEQNKGRYLNGECQAEGHIVLGEETEDGISTVYALMMYGEYEFQNVDYFIKSAGTGVIPVVLKYDIRLDSHTPLVDFQWPEDGSRYNDSIKELFPEQFWDRTLTIQDEDRRILTEMERGYAERYLDSIGRDAVVGDYADLEHTLLTDLGVSVEVSNQMNVYEKTMGPYPNWVGSTEKIEDGVRYMYSLFYDEETNQVIYEKRVFETDETIEKYIYDAETGEPV